MDSAIEDHQTCIAIFASCQPQDPAVAIVGFDLAVELWPMPGFSVAGRHDDAPRSPHLVLISSSPFKVPIA